MSISRTDVEHVARLAMLDIEPAEVEALTTQLGRIVDYVSQIADVTGGAELPAFRGGPTAAPLRPDVVAPVPLARTPAELAPDMRDGLFVVPRLGHLEGE